MKAPSSAFSSFFFSFSPPQFASPLPLGFPLGFHFLFEVAWPLPWSLGPAYLWAELAPLPPLPSLPLFLWPLCKALAVVFPPPLLQRIPILFPPGTGGSAGGG